MKRLTPLVAAMLLGLWGCSEADLPPSYRSIELPAARLASAEAKLRGRALFLQHCALCHGEEANGRGLRGNLSSQPTDFTDAAWRRRATPRRIFYVVREGVQGTAMPAWKVLDEEQSWDLVAFLLAVTRGS